MQPTKFPDNRRKKSPCAPYQKSNGECARFPSRRPQCQIYGAVCCGKHFSRFLKEDLARRSQAHPMLRPIEQRHPDFFFKIKHLFADR